MKRCKLTIELLSDLCVADGGVYNSLIDTDVCKDKYGIPYIPAKRIRGCLRECALELRDWGMDVSPEKLFGTGGDKSNSSKLRIENAYLKGYEDILDEISKGNATIYHPQNILSLYTSIRSQTSIDSKTGAAKDKSLRTIRVINKGLIFESEITLYDDEQFENLKNCCKIFRNMGLARTRGLGEIKVNLVETAAKKTLSAPKAYNGESTLLYSITLKEPMICKSINGGESNSLDYIEGSKIIGLLAKTLKNNEQLKAILADSTLKFSNAYITKEGSRFTELPAYIYAIKNDKKNYINRLFYVDNENEKRQINGMKHCYIKLDDNDALNKVSVEMEERYHHSRPSDKSIGRAVKNTDESKFYQLSSISEGQIFSGYISGNQDTIKSIYETLADVDICYMGYGSSSEYGKCSFNIEPVSDIQLTSVCAKEFVVTLNSPAIVYNENAMYSTQKADLLEEVLVSMGLNDKENIDVDSSKFFIKYIDIGGFNVTWGERKPTITGFDKGTAIKLVFKQDVTVNIGEQLYIGERNQEGYGEVAIKPLWKSNEDQWVIRKEKDSNNNVTAIGKCGALICNRLLEEKMKNDVILAVKDNKDLTDEATRPTISNMILIYQGRGTMLDIKKDVEARFEAKASENKKDKSAKANKILKIANSNYKATTDNFCEDLGIKRESISLSDDELERMYLYAFLLELKYAIRAKKGDGK